MLSFLLLVFIFFFCKVCGLFIFLLPGRSSEGIFFFFVITEECFFSVLILNSFVTIAKFYLNSVNVAKVTACFESFILIVWIVGIDVYVYHLMPLLFVMSVSTHWCAQFFSCMFIYSKIFLLASIIGNRFRLIIPIYN